MDNTNAEQVGETNTQMEAGVVNPNRYVCLVTLGDEDVACNYADIRDNWAVLHFDGGRIKYVRISHLNEVTLNHLEIPR